MRQWKFIALSVGLLSTQVALPVAAEALNAPEALDAAEAQSPAEATPRILPYDDLRQIIPIAVLGERPGERPIDELRARGAELNGQIVELQGVVIGTVVDGNARRVVMEIDGRATLLRAGSDLDTDSFAALKSGAFARVLARVQPPSATAVNGDVQLSILAATNQPAPPVTSTLPDAPDEANLVQLSEELTELPTMTEMRVPEPENRPEIALIQTTRTPPADPLAHFIETYQPAYQAMVRRHNGKLKDDQVKEIVVALLTAGYKNNMDPRFLASIIAVESNFDIFALSKSGALGLGQLMPFNLKEAGVTNPWSPTQNINGTARLMRKHLDDYKGRPNATLLAVAAYNAGSGAVRRAGYKVPDGEQVQRYVWKVYYRYKAFAPDMF